MVGSPRGVASNPTSPGSKSATQYMDTSTSLGQSQPPPPQQQQQPLRHPTGASSSTDQDTDLADEDEGDLENTGSGTLQSRRQKRLERNRESARLSRRRRKQYLEVLEERVAQLSQQMDSGRRHHVAQAVPVVAHKRLQVIPQGPSPFGSVLCRTSGELSVAATFTWQQLHSFCAPPATQVTLWLTLQNDDYYRGGRAASERLSAARIGERMLQNGNDKVTPAQTMWPLLCNEIGLSYDQEEKVRMYQRTLLQTQESWLSRHVAFAAKTSMDSLHEATQAVALRIGNRERNTHAMLNKMPHGTDKMARLHAYVKSKRQEILNKLPRHSYMPPTAATPQPGQQPPSPQKHYETSPHQHLAANLYVLNHRLTTILKTIPPAAPMVVGPALKKLSRRPSFESLGARSGNADTPKNGKNHHDGMDNKGLSRDNSYPSTGSLKRSASEMSMDSGENERHHRPSVDPMEAQVNAQETIHKHLAHVKEIMPQTKVPTMAMMVPQADRGSGILPVGTSSSPSPPPPPTMSSMAPPPAVDATASYELIAGEPLPDPVPMSVLSSTPAPAFMTPAAPMATYAPAPAAVMQQPQQQQHIVHHVPQAPAPAAAGIYLSGVQPASAPNLGAPAPLVAQLAPSPPSAHPGMVATHEDQPSPKQRRSASSFFPPALGVVPEEMWSAEAAEDFLMNFVDEDWAIGEGVETDM